uniref:Chitin-binding type-2 domain-containing protein n=1 Tax=Phthorimaea operculella granulovirus TaxID=192584 RepID=A0A481SDR4_9BBAC|nr:hypothetical protein PhopGVgp043 [Phthorimaea operculella granulovirus]QBH66658.1 hypothetical protein PhopGVgp043 [Phthorimaea operculella granulovirus]QBH66788.1 hypothetical protein PhopGVgp043 [Phthorimaea operculella granulovirus]QBH67047.1 hypothetical protein PhopGVgp043 [Phthorimaea operculella granulovirus]QBH67177.1 hypothetical protein PhopGVgp043 [Phthorimaea operculella granulovirus]
MKYIWLGLFVFVILFVVMSFSSSPTPQPQPTPPEPTPPPPICKSDQVEFVPNPDNCTQYYVCITMEPVLLYCPRGSAYDIELQECKPLEMVSCGNRPLELYN